VIQFINNEILTNGGGPEFYVAFSSRPWTEVEDQLCTILADPQVSRALKRSCAWSSLALGVRMIVRQREKQVRRVRRLQDKVEEHDIASWALVSKLQELREERDEAVAQLRFTQAALRQAIDEREVLRHKLHRANRSAQIIPLAQDIVPTTQAEQLGAGVVLLHAEQQTDMGGLQAVGGIGVMDIYGRQYFQAQIPAPTAVVYIPGPSSSWVPTMKTPHPIPIPNPLTLHPSFPVNIPFLPPQPPAVLMEAATGVFPLHIPPMGIYPPGPWAVSGFQREMAPQWDQTCYIPVEQSEILQGSSLLGDHRNLGQEEGSESLQKMLSLGNRWSHIQEEEPQKPQGMDLLGESGLHNQEDQERPQGLDPLGSTRSQGQEEGPEMAQGLHPLRLRRSHSRERVEIVQGMAALDLSRRHSLEEGAESAQGMAAPVFSRNHNQEKGSERLQETPFWESRSQAVSPKKMQLQRKKFKKPQGKKTSESQSASHYSQENWFCPWCKAINFSWRTFCYKCKRVYMPVESGDVDSGHTH
jgi:hypothetical protein